MGRAPDMIRRIITRRTVSYHLHTANLLLRHVEFRGGMPMNSSLTSPLSELSRNRLAGESASTPSRRATLRSLITKVWSWPSRLFSWAVVRVLVIFLIGFAAGIAWSDGGAARKAVAGWSPYLAWLAPASAPGGTSADRFKAMSVALASARQSLDKLSTEMSKVQTQDGDAPRRRASR
jgi:hypothetical protein